MSMDIGTNAPDWRDEVRALAREDVRRLGDIEDGDYYRICAAIVAEDGIAEALCQAIAAMNDEDVARLGVNWDERLTGTECEVYQRRFGEHLWRALGSWASARLGEELDVQVQNEDDRRAAWREESAEAAAERRREALSDPHG